MPKYVPTPQKHTLSTKGGIFGLLYFKAAFLLFGVIWAKVVDYRIQKVLIKTTFEIIQKIAKSDIISKNT